jgi:hypothetical protein
MEDINQFILSKIDKIEAKLDAIDSKVGEFNIYSRVEIAKLNVKAGIWGGLSGLIAAVGAILMWLASRGG